MRPLTLPREGLSRAREGPRTLISPPYGASHRPRPRLPLRVRLRLVWRSLWLRDGESIDLWVPPYIVVADLLTGECDFAYERGQMGEIRAHDMGVEPCHGRREVCVSRAEVRIHVGYGEHLHVCREHDKELRER